MPRQESFERAFAATSRGNVDVPGVTTRAFFFSRQSVPSLRFKRDTSAATVRRSPGGNLFASAPQSEYRAAGMLLS